MSENNQIREVIINYKKHPPKCPYCDNKLTPLYPFRMHVFDIGWINDGYQIHAF